MHAWRYGSKWPSNDHKNIHFDNEQDTHTRSEHEEESGYALDLDFPSHPEYSLVSHPRRSGLVGETWPFKTHLPWHPPPKLGFGGACMTNGGTQPRASEESLLPAPCSPPSCSPADESWASPQNPCISIRPLIGRPSRDPTLGARTFEFQLQKLILVYSS